MKTPESAEQDAKFFLDFDLAVLGAEEPRYLEYCEGIYREYAHLGSKLPGLRAKVMEGFLQHERLYFTEAFVAQREARARSNVRKEIERLQKQQQPAEEAAEG